MKKQTEKKKKTDVKNTVGRDNLRRFFRNRAAVVGLILLGVIVFGAIFVSVLSPYSYEEMDLKNRAILFSPEHWLGTDQYGRDMLTRLLYGARVSLFVGFLSVALGCAVGGFLGAISAYYGGRTDNLIMRFLDIWHSIPSTLLAIALAAAMGNGMKNAIIAIGLTTIPQYARVVRASVMTVKNQEYIEAARCIGNKTPRILLVHTIPNALAPIIVQASLGVANAIITTASLSFLGLGVQPPTPEWGSMLSAARQFIRSDWQLITYPGLFIMLTVISLNLVGDGLRDALDPRLKR